MLQGIVDTNYVFWDYKFGCIGNMYEWTLIKPRNVWRDCIKCAFLPYKLLRDYAYPMCPWIYIPFKSCPIGLEGYKTNLNFILDFTCICVKYASGILKGRQRIITWRVDVFYDILLI